MLDIQFCWMPDPIGFWCIDIFSLLAGTVYRRAHGVCNDFYLLGTLVLLASGTQILSDRFSKVLT